MLRRRSQGAWTCSWEGERARSVSFCALLHDALLAASPVQPPLLYMYWATTTCQKGFFIPHFICSYRPEAYR